MVKKEALNPESLETLKTIPLFKAFKTDEKKLSALASLMSERTVMAGSYLVKEGELGKEMFILDRGEVEITKTTLENEQYTVVVLNEKNNAFFGELALLDEDKRSASIKATKDCQVLVLGRSEFETLENTHPDIGLIITRELAKIVCRRFRTTNEDVILLFEALVNEVSQMEIE